MRAHYKNCYEVARFCKGMKINAAIQHMDRVVAHTAIIPFRKHSGGIGRASQAKVYGLPFGRWPEKACKAVKELLVNLKLTLRPRDSILTDALSTTSSSREPSKDAEEPTEPTVALVHTSPPTATLNSTASRPVVR